VGASRWIPGRGGFVILISTRRIKPLSYVEGIHSKDCSVFNLPVPKALSPIAITSHSTPGHRSRGVRVVEGTEDTALAPAIRQQLARIVQSSMFAQSERMSRFLRFIVEHAIEGNQAYLKEYVIGSEVYDRRPPYHPSQDSIVRTEARRLRGKLKEYYEVEGRNDPVYICLRPGSYAPDFNHKQGLTRAQSAANAGDPFLSAKISPIAIAILPFRDISGSPLSSIYARGIPDELAYTLMRTKGCRVMSPSSMEHFCAREQDVATAMSKVGAQIAFEGSVRDDGNRVRVTARIVDAAGFQLWAARFDADTDAQTLFTIEEQIASALSAGFDALFGEPQRPSAG
jgi:TolB-like protein